MMIVAKCPLRISLVGGSTDQEGFIEKYGRGSVISFPSNLFAYISVHDNNRGKYIINYSKREEVDSVDQIKNDVARVCLQHFQTVGPVTITFNTDILATGSGLASSTAYTIALVKALSIYTNCHFTEFDTCELALRLERKFNPLTGYQDPYGCGIGGFKRIDFTKSGRPSFTFLDSDFISSRFVMALYHTGVSRNSTNILTSLDLDKSLPLLYKVDWMQEAIQKGDEEKFLEIFREGWESKKKTSSLILEDQNLQKLDKTFQENKNILAVKLCFLPGTQIKTEYSYKNIEDVIPGERVFDHQNNIQTVEEHISRTYKGKIFELTVTGLKDKIYTTPEHPFYLCRKNNKIKRLQNKIGQNRNIPYEGYFIEAKKLTKKDCLLIPFETNIIDTEYIFLEKNIHQSKFSKTNIYKNIPYKINITHDFLELLGWFITEGCASKTQFQFAMHKKEICFAKNIARIIFDTFGKSVTITTKDNNLKIIGNSIIVSKFLNDLCGKHAKNKRIPSFAMTLPLEKQATLLLALWRGDGCVRHVVDKRTNKNSIRCSYKTISFILAKQVQNLCLRLGFVAGIKEEKEKVGHQKSYTISINGDDALAFYNFYYKKQLFAVERKNKKQLSLKKDIIEIDGNHYVKRSIRNIKTIDYEGPVYNLSIANSHTYIANDVAVHNCGAGGGGYFLTLCRKNGPAPTINSIKPIYVNISERGVVGVQI